MVIITRCYSNRSMLSLISYSSKEVWRWEYPLLWLGRKSEECEMSLSFSLAKLFFGIIIQWNKIEQHWKRSYCIRASVDVLCVWGWHKWNLAWSMHKTSSNPGRKPRSTFKNTSSNFGTIFSYIHMPSPFPVFRENRLLSDFTLIIFFLFFFQPCNLPTIYSWSANVFTKGLSSRQRRFLRLWTVLEPSSKQCARDAVGRRLGYPPQPDSWHYTTWFRASTCVLVWVKKWKEKKACERREKWTGTGGDSSASSKHRANSRTLRLLAWGYRVWSHVNCNLFYRYQ